MQLSPYFPQAAVSPFVPPAVLRTGALTARLDRLYARTEQAPAVFASQLGPIRVQGRDFPLPRFLYLSPFGSDETLRVAVHAGYDHRDERSTDALLHFIERLLLAPDLGDGVNLAFFPLIDILGHASDDIRGLAAESWVAPLAPEIDLLARDARQRAYDVFVRLETAPAAAGSEDDLITVRVRGGFSEDLRDVGDTLLSSAEFEPFPVRFETEAGAIGDGPLSLTDDLGRAPLELTFALPASWTAELYREAVSLVFKRLLLRYRGHQSFGQHI